MLAHARPPATTESQALFPVASLDRHLIHWEDYLDTPTPFESRGGHWYKREDAFAPLGPGGINGAKLRQLIWLIASRPTPPHGIITGASVHSPQLSMAALVARHFDLPIRIVLGGSSERSALRHENVAIAALVGASIRFNPERLNNPPLQRNLAIQRTVLAESRALPDWYYLHYGITTPPDASDAEVAAFHALGALQVRAFPPGVTTLYMTMGSANSCVSVLYGLALDPPPDLQRIVLLGIGPTRLDWMENRLSAIERATGASVRARFRRAYQEHHALSCMHNVSAAPDAPFLLEHIDLHALGFAKYGVRFPYRIDGLELHPVYEGKAMTYMRQRARTFEPWWLADGRSLFWIVGSPPRIDAMPALLALRGERGEQGEQESP